MGMCLIRVDGLILLGLAGCPKIGDELTVDSVKKGSDAPEGGGVYQFTDKWW